LSLDQPTREESGSAEASARLPARRRRTLRSKLILLVMIPLTLAAVLTTGMSAWRDAQEATHLETAELRSTATIIAAFAADAVAEGDRTTAFAALRSIAQMDEVTYARIDTPDGDTLVETGAGARLARDVRLTGESGRLSFLDLFRTHTMEVSQPVMSGGRQVGTVVLLSQSKGAIGRTKTAIAVTIFGCSAAALAGLLVAFRMQRRISAPIVGLTKAMGAVRASHDYSLRTDVQSDDEVGDLIDGFNEMLREIRERDGKLAAHMQNLEREVADRTADLRVAKEAAEAANASKSDFLATMSHEIRTPMNGIMVMAEMLAAADMPQRQRRYAEVIAKSGQSLLSIINDILDFSKIEAGKMDLEQVPVDLSDLVDDVTSLFWERARSKNIDLAGFVDPSVPRKIVGDPTRLRQVIGNLANNAIKFTETGGVLIRVEMEPKQPGCVRVSIQDTGIGIPQHKIATLFEAFTQVDQSTTRRFGGTGLGLAICKRLVDAMGGEVTVTSTEGRGSTFSFVIPAETVEPVQPWPALASTAFARAAVGCAGVSSRWALSRYLTLAGAAIVKDQPAFFVGEPAACAGPLPRPAVAVAEYGDPEPFERLKAGALDAVLVQPFRRAELEAVLARLAEGRSLADLQAELDSAGTAGDAQMPRFEGRRILIADDSAVNREVAMEALSRLGATSLVVVDGAKAVQAVADDPSIELVLMDGSMPEMDGFEATRAIRAAEAAAGRARLPVVALTAHVVGTGADAWREADMDAVLHKPFTLAALAETLAKFLEPSGFGAAVSPPEPAAAAAEPQAGAAAEDPDALLDAAVTRDLSSLAASGKADFVEKIHRLYATNAPDSLSAVQQAARDGDGEALARAAHALKSMSYNIGAKKVARLCSAMEARGRAGDAVSQADVVELGEALHATLAALGGKNEGGGGASEEAALLADLKAAIAGAPGAGSLVMHYQPQMDRAGETLVGCEALVRWTHPQRGSVSPADFVPLAERAGVIGDLTDFVVRRVCQEARQLGDLRVGFNASALEFSKPGFADRLARLAAESDLPLERLEVEITETAALDDAENTKANIAKLRELGIKVALDDFGAGYTSLRFLRMFPFDKLKIDRDFILDCEKDAEAATIVHAVVSIGRALGMKVVAEGVETEAQRNFLKVAGVHAMQGWLFGKAMPADELAARYRLANGERAVA
jgi:signal transduction histidine kinase/EAL domain-containing protein (putative c-di-GMP-specific phosphodiesterase class I)/CheY-like chemotaxis protein/HPt (histidine-containing phosphotransfer) domain-containing protein